MKDRNVILWGYDFFCCYSVVELTIVETLYLGNVYSLRMRDVRPVCRCRAIYLDFNSTMREVETTVTSNE